MWTPPTPPPGETRRNTPAPFWPSCTHGAREEGYYWTRSDGSARTQSLWNLLCCKQDSNCHGRTLKQKLTTCVRMLCPLTPMMSSFFVLYPEPYFPKPFKFVLLNGGFPSFVTVLVNLLLVGIICSFLPFVQSPLGGPHRKTKCRPAQHAACSQNVVASALD